MKILIQNYPAFHNSTEENLPRSHHTCSKRIWKCDILYFQNLNQNFTSYNFKKRNFTTFWFSSFCFPSKLRFYMYIWCRHLLSHLFSILFLCINSFRLYSKHFFKISFFEALIFIDEKHFKSDTMCYFIISHIWTIPRMWFSLRWNDLHQCDWGFLCGK